MISPKKKRFRVDTPGCMNVRHPALRNRNGSFRLAQDTHDQKEWNIKKSTQESDSRSAAEPPAKALPRQRFSTILDREAIAWVVLGITVILTIGLWRYSETEFARRANESFENDARKQATLLLGRMQDYEQALRGGAALFAAKGRVSRAEWHAYVEMLHLDNALLGIPGTGFSLMVPKGAKQRHERIR